MARTLLKMAMALFAIVAIIVAAGVVIGVSIAKADTCKPTWTVGIGGLNDNTSQRFENVVDHRIQYNSWSTRNGADELNRVIRAHRTACPGDHIKAIGYSGGAAALHVWASENGRTIGGKANIILIGDPKRPAGPGGPGFAATDFPFNVIRPLAGADANYGGLPTMQVCNSTDHICNSQSDWTGYQTGAHGAYDFNPHNYSNAANGQIYR